MRSYMDFAYIYDRLTYDVDYDEWASYIEKLFKAHSAIDISLVCDLACGTGSMCTALSDKGYDMIGIDLSESMLDVAMGKSVGKNILYLNQDITDFELYGTVDAFVCLLDSVNYITEDTGLKKLFALADNYLNPGGVFIFDVNTRKKFEDVLGDNTYIYDDDDIFYSWENAYSDGFCEMNLNFFVRDGNGLYNRICEEHLQRYYDTDSVVSALEGTDLEVVAIYDELTKKKPSKNSERIFYILQKKR